MEVDPRKYRLRAFENNFVKPILSYLEQEPFLELEAQRTLFFEGLLTRSGEPGPLGDQSAAASVGLMQARLLAEASDWIRIGLDIGYFSPEIDPIPLSFGGIDFHHDRRLLQAFWQARRRHDRPRVYDVDQLTFERDLTAATEQLDDRGNMELLRLLYFANQREWEERLELLVELASNLERRPEASYSDALMEELRWAFFEDFDPTLYPYKLGPSSWRDIRQFTPLSGGSGAGRFDQLSAVRDRIAAAAEKIGSGDDSTTSVLLASLLQTERTGRPDRLNLSLIFTRLNSPALPPQDQWILRQFPDFPEI